MWQNQTPLIHARWIWFPHQVRFHISGRKKIPRILWKQLNRKHTKNAMTRTTSYYCTFVTKKISWELVQKSVLCTSRSTSLFFWSKNTDQKFSPRFVLIFGTKATSFEVNVYTSVWLLFKTQGRRKLTLVLKTSVKLVSQVATTTPHH